MHIRAMNLPIRSSLLPAFLGLFALQQPQAASAQAGSLDPAFATAGKYVQDFGFQDNLTKVRIQPADQKIVAVGTALTPAFAGKLLVVRLNADGTPDNTFNGSGSLVITAFNESYAYDLFFPADGKIVVVGARADANFQFSMLALRLNADGSLDNTFGTGGFSEPEISTADDFAYAVAPLANGKMLLAGTALDDQFRNQPVVVRLNEDGSVDDSFGTNGVAGLSVDQTDNKFWNVGIQSDGSIIASGHLDQGLTGTGQFNQDVLVARFTAEGTLDATFGNSGTVVRPISAEYVESAFAMAIGTDDAIYLGGYTTQLDFSFDGFVMKLDGGGTADASFGTSGLVIFDNAVQDVFTGLALQPDGKLLACGTSGGFFFDPRDQLVSRFNTAGVLDTAFDTDGYCLNNVVGNFDEANALTLQADGKIVVAGKANTGSNNDATVFRHLNDINTMVRDEVSPSQPMLFPNPASAGSTLLLSVDGTVRRIRLFDAKGAEVTFDQRTLAGPWSSLQLPSTLVAGTYALQVTTDRGTTTTRIVVQD